MSSNLRPTIGLYAGIFNIKGQILLVKINCGEYISQWNLPGGTVELKNIKKPIDERFLLYELFREIKEETGLEIFRTLNNSKILWPTLLKDGTDLAIPILIGTIKATPPIGETQYASIEDIQTLAKGTGKTRLLGGYGGRTHRMILRILSHSSNRKCRQEANNILRNLFTKYTEDPE